MEVELIKCECCGLKEECTGDYINTIKSKFIGKFLCGLCSEAVRDEVTRSSSSNPTKQNLEVVDEAVKAHMSFCRKYKSNPAFRVADGMRQMLRRRSSEKLVTSGASSVGSSSSGKKYSRALSLSSAQVGDEFVR
ncbi:hypothetical protein Droror1_Dr00015510 [Drosera rotundifolia]